MGEVFMVVERVERVIVRSVHEQKYQIVKEILH